MFVHRCRIAAIIFLLLIASATLTELFLISGSAEPSKTSSEHEDQTTPPLPEIKAVAKTGTSPFFKPVNQARSPQTLFSPSWFWRSGTVAIALLPLAVLNLFRSIGPHPMESPPPNQGSRIQYFEPNGPPEPWSRLAAETSTHYIYETAWGEYRFRKQLPLMMEFYGPEQGFCRAFQESVNGTVSCIDFYSNKPYNGTAITWMEINGVPAAPISFSILQASDTIFRGYGVLVGGGIPFSVYGVEVKVDFNHSAKAPKITISATLVSGPSRNHRIIWAGLARGTVDVLQQDIAIYANTQAYLGQLKKLRFSYEAGDPQSWRNMIIIDWGDAGPADTYIGTFTVSTLSFTGWMVKFPLNIDIIDPSAQVFGPGTVDPGFTTTGEKTLLTMATTLPAGGKNVILCVFMSNAALDITAQGVFRIYKGATLLYQTYITEYFNTAGQRSKPRLVIAIDSSPSGNDTYSFRINITTAGSSTGVVHVQGMVIKADDVSWGYNTTAVSIANGATATVTSISTNFSAGSKVALVAVLYGSHTTSGNYYIGAGNYRLKSGGTILASNQFSTGAFEASRPAWVSLSYLVIPASGSQVYSLEVYNDSGQTFNFYGEIVAFTVSDGAFLDTASVALTNGSQVTVGNLTTSLSGDVAVVALAAAENTGSSNITPFNAGDVVLQKDNSTTGQISNLVGWGVFGHTSTQSRSSILPMFRYDTSVSNPSYQVKMTARESGINGEAKILAFTLSGAPQSFVYTLSETVSASDRVLKARVFIRSDAVSGSDSLTVLRLVPRYVSDTASASDMLVRLGVFTRPITESAAASDSLAAFRIFIRAVSEAVSGSDSLSRLVMFLRQVGETATLSDTLTRLKGFLIAVTDAVAASDSFMRAVAFLRHVEEPVSLGESLTKPFTSMSLLETLVAADLLAVVAPSGSGGAASPPPQSGVSLPGGDAGLLITLLTVVGGGLAVAAGRRRRKSMGEVWRSVMKRPKMKKPVVRLKRHKERMGE